MAQRNGISQQATAYGQDARATGVSHALSGPEPTSRRRFLSQIGLAASGAVFLSGCHSGCATKPPRPSTGAGPTPPSKVPDIARIEPPPPPWRPEIPTSEPMLRVRIGTFEAATKSSETQRLTLAAPGGWIQVRDLERGRSPFTLRSPVTITRPDGRWTVIDAGDSGRSGFRAPLDEAMTLVCNALESRSGASPATLQIGEAEYSGSIHLVPLDVGGASSSEVADPRVPGAPGVPAAPAQPRSGFDIINHIGLEHYLPGVLAKELFSHWHAEAFAAQAIAARSFACMESQYYASRRHFDLTNTQASQAYIGRTSLRVAIEAAERTRGQVLAWDGKLVPGYYSSCCGGSAPSAVEAIGPNPANDIPPLRARSGPNACTAAPVYRWRNERTVADLTQRLNAWGAAMGDAAAKSLTSVRSIEAAELNEFGRPRSFRIIDLADRVATIPARRFREAADFTPQAMSAPREALRSSFFTAAVEAGRVIFSGRGYGHGVGMCQYGAEALANRGVRARDMLGLYYPDSTIVAAYT